MLLSKQFKNVAIVDDVSDVTTIYSKALEKHGHHVLFTATSGEEMVEALKNGKLPDIEVVIMDYRMKGMNGLEASREILKYRPDIKIVIATGDDGITANTLRDAGVSSYLVKPFTMAKLVECINNI